MRELIPLYLHQCEGVEFLVKRKSAGLFWEMGVGKSRAALVAAKRLFDAGKIDRVLVLAPAAVRFAWIEEIGKLVISGGRFNVLSYNPAKQAFYYSAPSNKDSGIIPSITLPVLIVSYALLPQARHVAALKDWCFSGNAILIADESSFLKNRTAKQTKGASSIAKSCSYRWLLTGTPIANSPLDLYGQALVMSNGDGPLKGFANYYHFRSRYAVTQPMRFGGGRTFQQVVDYQNIDELTKKFAPYVSRVEKKDVLDLPDKSYTVREVQLDVETWRVYQELKREAMLALGDGEAKPEPNAAVRLLRLCQITSGHVGQPGGIFEYEGNYPPNVKQFTEEHMTRDVSSEKLDFLVDSILEGELSNVNALICWTRWRRERERLQALLATKIEVYRIFGGQQEKNRNAEIQGFQTSTGRRVLVAQPHAGGYGLTLTAASTTVYLSNTFSFIDRVQSEDRCHRIGQKNPVTYVDVIAVGPEGQKTVDAHVLEALRAKKDLATITCNAWRRILED